MIIILNKHMGADNSYVYCTTIPMSRMCHILQQRHMRWYFYVTMVFRAPLFLLSRVYATYLWIGLLLQMRHYDTASGLFMLRALNIAWPEKSKQLNFLRRPFESMRLCNEKNSWNVRISLIRSVDRAHES